MAITAAQVLAAVVAEIPQIFDDAVDGALRGEGAFIAEGNPSSVVGKVSQAAARSACRVYGTGSVELNPAAAERYERACRPYLDGITPGGGAGIETPFQGGQCEVRYDVSGSYVSNQTDVGGCGTTRQWAVQGLPGPIGGIGRGNGVQGGWLVVGNGFNFNAIDVGTNKQLIDVDTCGESVGNQVVRAQKPFISSVTRQDGLPDDCGDPEPVIKPPTPIGDPQPPTFRFNPGGGIDVPIGVELFPDGQISVDIGTGPITFAPFSDFSAASGGGGGGGGTPVPGTAGATADTGAGGAGGQGGQAEGEAPAGQVLTGVKVDILTAPPNRVRLTDDVDRGVVYVYMGAAEGLALEPTGSLVKSGQFFFAQKDYLTKWDVRARVGYNIRVTPYYRDKVDGTAVS